MKKTKTQKGITLIALIITIIILLILAVVSIREIQGDGIIAKARQAAAEYNQAQINEIDKMSEFAALIEAQTGNSGGSTETVNISEAGVVLSTTETTSVTDAKGNIIKVPAGFKIVNTSDTVDKGIVIEDVSAGNTGSQFVWVPVGTITKSDGTPETIGLNRYTFGANGTPTPQGDAVINTYYQELATSTYGNTTAKNIEGFISSANNNGGYYIGRNEADNNNRSQTEAASLAGGMYNSETFTSDLMNSYAWDTTIVFIQTFGKSDYSQISGGSIYNSNEQDYQLNIINLAGGYVEWTTETCSGYGGIGFSTRGAGSEEDSPLTVSSRIPGVAYDVARYRTLLYIN